MLYVTHDQIEAMAMSDKIALMQSGELPQVGRPMNCIIARHGRGRSVDRSHRHG